MNFESVLKILLIAIYSGLINRISADFTFGNYKVLKNTKAALNAITVSKTSSLLKCTVLCSKTEGCNRANWSNSRCELLENPTGEVSLIEDPSAKYICKYFLYGI